jgi:two-component system phosphate regulon sensor histidine kinase PhoR
LTARIFIKLIVGVLCVLIVALAAVDVLVSRLAEQTYIEKQRRDLVRTARMLAELFPEGFAGLPRGQLLRLARQADVRLTVIAPDGRVLADSAADPAQMENHAARPEVAAALGRREGISTRLSPTVGISFLYAAVPIPAGALRLAVPLSDISAHVTAIRKETLLSMVYAFIPAMLVAAFFARSVSSRLGAIIEYAGRLADGGFRRRLGWTGKDEMSLLARKLDETAAKLEATFDELKREHAELERVEQIRKDFVINVSHELRTPLASIQGYTETLLGGAIHDPEHNVRFLNIIRANAERLGNLTADLLTLSHVEMKLRRFQWAAYRVNHILRECVEALRPLADRKGVTVELAAAPEGTEVFVDAEAVHQILSNLLDNAIKYTPEGGRVWVTAQPAPPDRRGQFVEISVKDTGIGIPRSDLPRLFERFYRVDKARSRELGGTGLGLAIVKHLVRALGGAIRVESDVGQGAVFAFTVPVEDLGLADEREVKTELTL